MADIRSVASLFFAYFKIIFFFLQEITLSTWGVAEMCNSIQANNTNLYNFMVILKGEKKYVCSQDYA